MATTQVKIALAESLEGGELVIPSEVVEELGVHAGESLTLEVVAGTLVVRRESGLARAKGAGAPWRKTPPPTQEEEDEALARAIADAGAHSE